jgi:hypothetical protein
MRFFWRSPAVGLLAHSSWISHLDDKNRRQGTSAPTLAASWSGPLDLWGALSEEEELAGLHLEQATVEQKTTIDSYGGNTRNHDLVLYAMTAGGEPVVVCVEAKAGESLGATVAEQVAAAAKAGQANPRSNASARIVDLVTRHCRYPIEDSRVSELRYQLLTAWAGTLVDAVGRARAVFALHEFRTDQRPEDHSSHNGAELARLAEAVLGCTLPPAGSAPWCVRVPDVAGVPARLYVAHVTTDLRGAALAKTSA